MEVSVRRVEPARTAPLRRQVLRPHERLEEVEAASRGGTAFAALDPTSGEVVSCALVLPDPPPVALEGAPEGLAWWRLRGMATAPGQRGQGIGGRVLGAVLDHLRPEGPLVLWCNARLPAAAFYERAGFRRSGAVWEEWPIGPHVRMWRPVGGPGDPGERPSGRP